MKTTFKVGAAIVVCLIVLLLTLSVTGLDPRDRTPGLWLKGNLVTTPVGDWSFSDQYRTLKVQTRTWYLLPHSVTTNCSTYNGQLYLTSPYKPGLQYPHGREWNENVARDPHVRLKIGDQLFDRTLTLVTDPTERAGVLQGKAKKYSQQKAPVDSQIVIFRVTSG